MRWFARLGWLCRDALIALFKYPVKNQQKWE